jgi:hypothetical protein
MIHYYYILLCMNKDYCVLLCMTKDYYILLCMTKDYYVLLCMIKDYYVLLCMIKDKKIPLIFSPVTSEKWNNRFFICSLILSSALISVQL